MINKHTVICLLVLMMILTGCDFLMPQEAETSPAVEETPQVTTVESAPVPDFGGNLRLIMRNPKTLNPLLNEDRSVDQILKLVFEPLFSLDEGFKPVPVLADSYVFAGDGTSIQVVMKADHLFHDGTPVTAYDVAYSVELLQSASDAAVYKPGVANIERISVTDDFSFTIYMKAPYGLILYDLNFPILSAGAQEDPAEYIPVGSGNYAFSKYTSMQSLELKAVPAADGKVYIETITGKITREEDVEQDAFEHSVIDVLNPAKFNWNQYAQRADEKLYEYTSNYMEFLGFNFNNDLLEDKSVRQAIAYALDRPAMAKEEYLSHVTITDGIVHPKSWLNTTAEEGYTYDLEQAKSLLNKELLLDVDGDGFYDAKANEPGIPLSLNLLVSEDNSNRVATAQLIRSQLADVGLKVNVDIQNTDGFKTKLAAGDFDMVLSGWKLSDSPDFYDLFHSSMQVSGSNFIRYNNAFMDIALAGVRGATTDEALKNSVQAVDQIYREELPYFTLYFVHSVVRAGKNVQGTLQPTTDYTLQGIDEIYLKVK